MVLGGNRCSVLFIKLQSVFHLCLILRGPAILDVTSYIKIGIDELTGVMQGLIDLLIGVAIATLTSLGVWRAPVLA